MHSCNNSEVIRMKHKTKCTICGYLDCTRKNLTKVPKCRTFPHQISETWNRLECWSCLGISANLHLRIIDGVASSVMISCLLVQELLGTTDTWSRL